jgi:hypothetical protein
MSVRLQRGTILFDDFELITTVNLSDGSMKAARAKWTEVLKVTAFKRDCFAYDCVCIVFEAAGMQLEVDEEMDGWEAMIAALPNYLPGIRTSEQWWNEVVHPAFATNVTHLFLRDPST